MIFSLVKTNEEKWYYADHNQQRGPFRQDVLLRLMHTESIHKDTLVWTESMSDWLPLGQCQVLLDAYLADQELQRSFYT